MEVSIKFTLSHAAQGQLLSNNADEILLLLLLLLYYSFTSTTTTASTTTTTTTITVTKKADLPCCLFFEYYNLWREKNSEVILHMDKYIRTQTEVTRDQFSIIQCP